MDVVYLDGARFDPRWIGEIKWYDRIGTRQPEQTKSIITMLKKKRGIKDTFFITKTIEKSITVEGRGMMIIPTAAYCYTVGRNLTKRLDLLEIQGS